MATTVPAASANSNAISAIAVFMTHPPGSLAMPSRRAPPMCVTHFTGRRDFGASSPRLGCFLGWLFWSVVHIYFLITVRDRFIVAFTWLWD